MKKNYLPIVLFIVAMLLPANILPAFSQSTDSFDNFLVKLSLSPSQVDEHNASHQIGYVNLVTKNGMAVKAPQDLAVGLESDDPAIASVPSAVTIKKDHNFAVFDIQTGDKDGKTTITSLFNDKMDFTSFKVGGSEESIPDDINLVINLPTKNMHVNSEMPFSVFVKTSDGNIIRAPYDIEVDIDYEDSLLTADEDKLIIKKGDYYAWSVIKTFKFVGNGFLRATSERLGIDTAENIEITSSLPISLAINIFPDKISGDAERTIDIFISLLDSDGLPAATPEDIPIELFSDEHAVGKEFDKRMQETDVVIKKGEFGYYFRESMNLAGFEDKDILVGASAEDLGIALSGFKTVRPLNIESPFAVNRTLTVFVLPQMPSNTTSILTYQINVKGPGANCDGSGSTEIQKGQYDIHPAAFICEGEFYPIQTNENYKAEGLVDKINIISSDNSLIKIKKSGNIESSHSYGTAIISSGDDIGDVTLATTVKEIGAGTNKTEVIDVFRHTNTKIFSPTGTDSIVVDKNGFFDLFLIAFDGKQRPKILDEGTKFILNPINDVLEIKTNRAFATSNFHSDSFNVGDEKIIKVDAVPIGIESDLGLKTTTIFNTQVSSSIEIELPFDNLDAKSEKPYNGIVQLRDLLGNPSTASKDLRINLDLDGAKIVNIPETVIISQGSSYATFPIYAIGQKGDATIDANIKGVIGSQTKISTASNDPKLKIFADGIEGALDIGKPSELTIFIDDENANSVSGAIVRFVSEPGVVIVPENTRTDETGMATVDLTANKGELVSIQIIASASGYSDGKQSFDYQVAGGSGPGIVLGLPDWVLYVGLAAVVGIAAVLVVFLKKPKSEMEEDDEYEYEDEI
jgi:hypothetical protein